MYKIFLQTILIGSVLLQTTHLFCSGAVQDITVEMNRVFDVSQAVIRSIKQVQDITTEYTLNTLISFARTSTEIPDTITIDVDNVMVDLNGTLEGIKLKIADNRKNIIIKNGIISTDGIALEVGANVSRVIINDIKITDSTGNLDIGIKVNSGCDSICILNSVIHSANQAGILFDSVDNSVIESCVIQDANLSGTDSSAGGIVLMNTHDCTIFECNVTKSNVRAILVEGDASSIHNKVLKCITTNNSGIGIEVNAQKSMVEGCIARCNGSHGFAFDGSAHGVATNLNNLTDCVSEYNTGSGFYAGADTNGNIVESSKSICNTGAGFYDLSSTGTNYYADNLAGNNSPNYNGVDGSAFGNKDLQ